MVRKICVIIALLFLAVIVFCSCKKSSLPVPTDIEGILNYQEVGVFAGVNYDEKALERDLKKIPNNLSSEEVYSYMVGLIGENYAQYTNVYNYLEDPNYYASMRLDPSVAALDGATSIVEILLDCSGSMADQVDGGIKMDLAKKEVQKFASKLPAGTRIGLRVFGHKGSSSEADFVEGSQTELLYPLGPYNEMAFTDTLKQLEPRGWTPIAKSLEAAGQDLAGQGNGVIYLVTDGIETCGGDPVAAAAAVKQQLNTQISINVIGFDVGDIQQLKDTSAAGGGNYVTAQNNQELQEVFQFELKERIADSIKNDFELFKKANSAMTETMEQEYSRMKKAAVLLQVGQDVNELINDRYRKLSRYQTEETLAITEKILKKGGFLD